MSNYDAIANLNIRQIQVFLTAVNTGSFTKSGEKLFMTQSMVSKDIASLERNLGFTVFKRTTHGIELTPAGRIVYQSWKGLIEGMERTVAAAEAAKEGNFRQIFITDYYTTVKKEYLWPYMEKFRKIYPDVDFMLDTVAPGKILDNLENRNCDIAYAPACELPVFQQDSMNWKHVYKCPNCVWVHESNPLYNQEKVTIQDLKHEVFIIVSPIVMTHYEKSVFELCNKAGFQPQKVLRVADVAAATMNLKLGKGIIIRDKAFDSADMQGIRIFELEGSEGGAIMAWKKDLTNETALKFISMYD